MSNVNKPIVIVRSGQSNSGGVTERSSFIPTDRLNGEQIYQMSWGIQGHSSVPVPPMGQFYQMEFPTQMIGMSQLTGCSFTMNLCKKLAKLYPTRPIYLIACDVPGTGFNTSNPYYTWGHDGYNSYENIPESQNGKYLTINMVNTIKQYSPTKSVDYIVEIQGENDKSNNTYQYQVIERITFLRKLFGNFVFAMGTMLPSWINLCVTMGMPAISDSTHRQLSHIIANSTTSFHDHLYDAYDGVHFSALSQRQIGIEFFNSIHRNIHAYNDERWEKLFRKNSIFWYDFTRQNSNYGYLANESLSFWDRISNKWNTNTKGIKVNHHACLWTTNDYINTNVNSSTLSSYTKIAIFTPTSDGDNQLGNIMSGSINSVLWIYLNEIQAIVGGQKYSIPSEQFTIQKNHKYLVILSVSPGQIIIKIHDFNNPTHKISFSVPVEASHTFNKDDVSIPMHIGNIPDLYNVCDGTTQYGFYGLIHFAAMLSKNMNDLECLNAIDYFNTYWTEETQ